MQTSKQTGFWTKNKTVSLSLVRKIFLKSFFYILWLLFCQSPSLYLPDIHWDVKRETFVISLSLRNWAEVMAKRLKGRCHRPSWVQIPLIKSCNCAKRRKQLLGRGGGTVVSVDAFYSDDPSSICAKIWNIYSNFFTWKERK